MRNTPSGHGPDRRAHRARSVGFALLAWLSVATVAWAVPTTGNSIRSDVLSRPQLSVFYDYRDPTPASWDTQAEWDTGTHSNTVASSAGTLSLPPTEEVVPDLSTPWWNTSWTGRRCYDIDHTAGTTSVTDYPVTVTLDTAGPIGGGRMLANGADLRAVASDGSTLLPLWVRGPLPSASTEIWVQVDSISAGGAAEFCLYWGNSTAPSVSNVYSVLTYSTPKPLYVTVSGRFGTPGAAVDVVAYIAGTIVTNGIVTTPPLARGATATFPAVSNSPATVVSATGPLESRGVGSGSDDDRDAFDTLVPLTFSGTQFVLPTTNKDQTFSVYAPFAPATVSILNGTTPGAGSPFTVAQGTSLTVVVDVTGANSGIVESNVPILVTHHAEREDSLVLHPTSSGPLYGVRTRDRNVGSATNGTTVTQTDSSGATWTGVIPRGGSHVEGGGDKAGGGPDDAIRISGSSPIGVIQRDDGKGDEASSFLPGAILFSEVFLPTSADYVSVVCPTSGITVTFGTTTHTCAGAVGAPGFATDDSGFAAGTRIFAPGGQPIYVFYDHPLGGGGSVRDESNLVGLLSGRQVVWPAPVVTQRLSEGHVAAMSGTWTSATVDTGTAGVFGLMAWTENLPAGTDAVWQVATSAADPPSSYVGPDGTPSSWFTSSSGEPVDFVHDGDRYARVRVTLTTTDPVAAPSITDSRLGTDLATFPSGPGSPMAVTVSGTAMVTSTHYLARIKTPAPLSPSVASLRITATPAIANATRADLVLDPGASLQTSIIAGVVVQPSGPGIPFDDTTPLHLRLVEEPLGPGTIEFSVTWTIEVLGSTTTVIEDDLSIVVSS